MRLSFTATKVLTRFFKSGSWWCASRKTHPRGGVSGAPSCLCRGPRLPLLLWACVWATPARDCVLLNPAIVVGEPGRESALFGREDESAFGGEGVPSTYECRDGLVAPPGHGGLDKWGGSPCASGRQVFYDDSRAPPGRPASSKEGELLALLLALPAESHGVLRSPVPKLYYYIGKTHRISDSAGSLREPHPGGLRGPPRESVLRVRSLWGKGGTLLWPPVFPLDV